MEIKQDNWLCRLRKYGVVAVGFRALASWVCAQAGAGMSISTGCCSCFAQMSHAGMEPVFNPHHADVLVVNGALSVKAAFVARRIYDQMPSPKYVIAFGNCAINGGLFADSYAVTSARDVLPVDVCVPGCPPVAADMVAGIEQLRGIIRSKIREG